MSAGDVSACSGHPLTWPESVAIVGVAAALVLIVCLALAFLLLLTGVLFGKRTHSSPASDGPGETVPGAGEHDGHPEAPSPVSGGPSSGGAA